MIYSLLPMKDGSDLVVTTEEGENYEYLFPQINVAQEFCSMRAWLQANPTRRKTKRGIKRFIAGWLIRATNQQATPSRVQAEAAVGRHYQ